jgi:2-polyprenyl-3-methyl-5-hydroxy-6-metoxy-1,4-benzoquinol methylase
MTTRQNIANQGPTELFSPTELPVRSTARTHSSSAKQGCISCGDDRTREFIAASDRFFARSNMYRLLQCESCSLVWLADPPKASEMDSHYGPNYDQFIRKATDKESERHWRRAVDTVQRYSQGGRLLDLGCGSGSFLHCLRGGAWTLWGIEMSAAAAQLARTRNLATILTDDVVQAPFPPETFDVITCFHVFEHMTSPREVLAKVKEWLKPGGIFCVHVPNIEAAEGRLFGSYWYPLELPRHLFHFSPRSLRQLAQASGLEEVRVTTAKVSFVEYSTRYMVDEALRKAGVPRPPLAEAAEPPLPWRAIRKGLRLTALPVLNWLIGLTGEGSIIEAVFRKPECDAAGHRHEVSR